MSTESHLDSATRSSRLPTRLSLATMMVEEDLMTLHVIEVEHLEVTERIAALYSERLAVLKGLLPELEQVEAQMRQRSAICSNIVLTLENT